MVLSQVKNSGILVVAAAIFVGALFVAPQARSADSLSKADVETIVKDYLMANPEIILEAVDSYRQKQEQAMLEAAEKSIDKNIALLTSADAPSTGNPKGDVTVVEFFDYNCGYCKRALPDIQTLLKADKNLRIVFREMPILSEASMAASQWALAAHKQGKYFEFHTALMEHKGSTDAAALEKLAKSVGLDVGRMKKDAASKEIDDMIKKDVMMATEIGIRGTPAFIVNGELHRGYLGPDGLKAAIDAARKPAEKKGG
jgi:protein-disulfide isomerase